MRALGRGRLTRGSTAGLVGMVAVACCLLASSASARVVIAKATGQKFGIVPVPHVLRAFNAAQPLRRLPSATPTCDLTVDPNCPSPLAYGGGPVQHSERVILFFWDPAQFASAPGYVSGLQTWVNGLAAGDFSTGNVASAVGNPLSVTEQYYDTSGPGGAKNFVSYAVSNGGTVMDSDPYPTSGCTNTYTDPVTSTQVTAPTCLTGDQLLGELANYVAAHNLPRGIGTEYFIMTPSTVGTCDDGSSTACSNSQYCGWHTSVGGSPSTELVFADMPWASGPGSCDVNRALGLPNLYSTPGIDPLVGVFSHELAETMTDPNPGTGWFSGSPTSADEIGDKCAYQYVTGAQAVQYSGLPQTGTGAFYNATLNGNNYLLQTEYSNAAGGCAQWNTDTQPVATIAAPASTSTGAPVAFSLANVVDPAGIAYVTWYFGDGAAALSTGTTPASHTYTAGGARTVTAVVTDNHGNQLKLTRPITVTQGVASLAVNLSKTHPAPKGLYTVKVSGRALAGGVLGGARNRSEVDLYEQPGGTCAATRKVESSRKSAVRIAQWFAAAGSFAFSQRRQAVSAKHATVRFCGYVSRTVSLTDAKATSFYTTT